MLKLLKPLKKPTITFTCEPADLGVFAEPVPAKSVIPDWFRKLPPIDQDHLHANNNGLTVKRCMPFLDAMTLGWVLPLGATVRLEISDEGATVNAGWDIDRVMVSNHNMHQVTGNPQAHRPPCKFHNYWTIATPPGWSCLFVPLINRPNAIFEVASGVVDTDTYRSLINFPFFATGKDGVYTIERGTPLVQVIPFKRDTSMISAEIRAERKDEADLRGKILKNTQASEGWYRKVARAAR
ncbi:MAG: hypothetical protein ACFCUN_09970 [Hyphomicrobiaceae bacterium]